MTRRRISSFLAEDVTQTGLTELTTEGASDAIVPIVAEATYPQNESKSSAQLSAPPPTLLPLNEENQKLLTELAPAISSGVVVKNAALKTPERGESGNTPGPEGQPPIIAGVDLEAFRALVRVRKPTVNLPSGKKMKATRAKLGLSQADIAETLGTSRDIVAKWEQGKQVPSRRLASAYMILYNEMLEMIGADGGQATN